MAIIEPVILEGQRITMEPLAPRHLEMLLEVGLEPVLWRYTASGVSNAEEMRTYLDAALADTKSLPFITLVRTEAGLLPAGSTRFMNIETTHKRLEIGHTWVTPRWQRSFVNTEAKYLMLRHAFEVLGYNRVEFKTDATNEKSRAALKRIGAVEEGTLRHHMITQTGRLRDSVYFSIIRPEWPSVKERLERMLGNAAQ